MFEVEKKFKVPADFKRVLVDQGWEFLKEIHFTDIYFDSESYELTRNDFWLRQRNQKLQLKCPVSVESGLDSVRIDKYMEIEDEPSIIDRLALVLTVESSRLAGKTTNNMIEMLGLKPIAEFESFRAKYKLDSFTIDLDKTNFGYELGEIEVMCEKQGDMKQATAKIFDMARKLGLNIHKDVTGKVGTYLKMKNRSLYDKLISKGILVAETL